MDVSNRLANYDDGGGCGGGARVVCERCDAAAGAPSHRLPAAWLGFRRRAPAASSGGGARVGWRCATRRRRRLRVGGYWGSPPPPAMKVRLGEVTGTTVGRGAAGGSG